MINSFELGKLYNIVGMGPWATLKKDIVVSAISLVSEMERLKIDLYNEAFKDYDIDEETYMQYVELNPKVYHAKVLDERNLSAVDNASEDIYFLESMIAKNISDELIPCTIFKWEIKSTPFSTDPKNHNTDENDSKFLSMMREFDMKGAIENALKDKLPESVTESIDYEELFLSKYEYEDIKRQREMRYSEAQKAIFERKMEENLIIQATTDKLIECNNRAENLKTIENTLFKKQQNLSELELRYNVALEATNATKAVLKEVFNKIKNDATIPNNPLEKYSTFEEFYKSFV